MASPGWKGSNRWGLKQLGLLRLLSPSFSPSVGGLSSTVAQVSRVARLLTRGSKGSCLHWAKAGGSRIIIYDLASEVMWHFFCPVLSLKAAIQAHSVSRGGDVDSTSWWPSAKVLREPVKPELFVCFSHWGGKENLPFFPKPSIRSFPKSHGWGNPHLSVAF